LEWLVDITRQRRLALVLVRVRKEGRDESCCLAVVIVWNEGATEEEGVRGKKPTGRADDAATRPAPAAETRRRRGKRRRRRAGTARRWWWRG